MRLKKLAALVLAGVLCVTSMVGCGVNADETAATLGEQTVSAGVVNFMCKYQKAMYDDLYISYFGEDYWEQDLYGYGTTMEEDLKDYVMATLHDLYTLQAHMSDYGVELTEEEKTAITEAAQAFIAANSEEAIEEFMATEEIVTEVLTLYTIQAKMYNAIIADVDTEVSDEEANMRGITLVEIGIDGAYDEDYNYVSYTDDEIAAIKSTAEKIVTEMSSSDLETAAENNGYTASESSYNKLDDTMDETLLAALNALGEGQTSGVIETTSALYIARIDAEVDEDATAENREAIIAERESTLYSEVLDAWQEDDGWTVNDSVVEEIDFHNILTQTSESTEDADSTEGE